MRTPSRRPLVLALLALLALAAAGPATAGAATAKRYQAPVFKKVTVKRDVVYGSAPGRSGTEQLKLDLYTPKGDTAKRRPAAILVHGGGFAAGDKGSGPAAELARTFARLGYVTASINYRLLLTSGCSGAAGVSPECYDAAIQDVNDGQAAVRWVRRYAKKLGVDPTRVAMGGESAGAIISVGAGTYEQVGTSGNPGYDSRPNAFLSISGGLPSGVFISAKTAPGLLFHGTADDVVPYQWSVDTVAKMKSFGVSAELVTYTGAKHVPWAQHGADMTRRSIAFLYRQLKLKGLR